MIKNYVLNNGQFFLVDYFKSWNIQQQKCYICSVIERCQPNELCSILDDIYLIFRQDLIMENNVENFSKLCRMNQDVKITIRNRRKSKKKSTTRFLTPNKSTKFTQIFCFQLLYSEYNEKLNNKVFKSKVVSLKSILPIDELNSVSDSENDSNLGFNSISAGPIWSNLNECSDVFQLNLIKYIEKVKKQEKNLEKGKNKKSYGRWKGHGRDNSVLKRNNSHNLNKDLYSFTCNTNDASKRILTLLNVSTNCYPIHSVICASLEQNEENRTFFNQMNFLNRKLNRIIIKELIKEITPHFYLLQFLSIKIISRLIYLNRMDYLSNNIINKIINNLNYKDFCSFMQTNKRFHSICRNNTFWKQATIQLIELTCPLLIKNGINEKDLNRINNVNSDFWNKLNKTVLNNIKSLNLQPQHRLKIKINPPSTINVEQCEDYNNIKLISDENDTFEKNEKKTKLLHENHIPTLDKSVRVKFLNFEDSHKSNKMYVNLHMSQYYSETEFDLNQPFQNDYNENSSIQNKKINSLTDNENVTESETEIDQFMDIRTKLESNQDVLNDQNHPIKLKWRKNKNIKNTLTSDRYGGFINNVFKTITLKTENETKINCFATDGIRVILGLRNGLISVHDARSGKFLKTLSEHKGYITCICIDDIFMYSGSWDSDVVIWNMHYFQKICNFRVHKRTISKIKVVQTFIISTSNEGLICFCDRKSFEMKYKFNVNTKGKFTIPMLNIIFGNDSIFINLSKGHVAQINVMNMDTEPYIYKLDLVLSVEVIQDIQIKSNLLVGGSNIGRLLCWKINNKITGQTSWQAHDTCVYAVEFGFNHLYSASVGEIKEWDLWSLTCLRIFCIKSSPISQLKIRNKRLMICTKEGKMYIWRLTARFIKNKMKTVFST